MRQQYGFIDLDEIDKDLNRRVARALEDVRGYRRVSVSALASWINWTPQRLGPYLKGTSMITAPMLVTLCQLLGVDIEAVLSDDPDDAMRWVLANSPNSAWWAARDSNPEPAD